MAVIYRGRYDFGSNYKRVLSFHEGDRFLQVSEKIGDTSWLYAININGEIGYIPKTYIALEEISEAELLEFVTRSLHSLNQTVILTGEEYSNSQKHAVRKLLYLRQLLNPAGDAIAERPSGAEECHTPDEEDLPECFHEKSDVISSILPRTDRARTESSVNARHENGYPAPVPSKPPSRTSKDISALYDDDDYGTYEVDKEQPVQNADVGARASLSTHSAESSSSTSSRQESASSKPESSSSRPDSGKIKPEVPKRKPCLTESAIQTDESVFTQPLEDFVYDVNIPQWFVQELVENVRRNTQLSYDNSKLAVGVVMECMQDAIPVFSSVCKKVVSGLTKCAEGEILVNTQDREKLEVIFNKLWSCREDEQQRSWPIHEDESLIRNNLDEVYNILVSADPRVCQEFIRRRGYEDIHMLVSYYQMEPRRSLRLAMLHVFHSLCELDIAVISHLLNSILPMELARDIQATLSDLEKSKYSALLLTVVFSTGQEPPHPLYEHVNAEFMSFLLDAVERSLDGLVSEEVADSLLSLMLAFNLHFNKDCTNLLLEAIKLRTDARFLTEKLLLLVNREDDPTRLTHHTLNSTNSVLKLLSDMFGDSTTAQVFYLNDVKVLLDIIVRQLTDLPVGDERRIVYFSLVRNVLENTNYEEHCHQQEGLQKCLQTAVNGEEILKEEQDLVNEIVKIRPKLFSVEIISRV